VRNLRLIIIFWLASFAMPGISLALGLGEINVSSFLNQPLRAEIDVISARPGEIDNLLVSLASSDSFARAGLSRPNHLTDLRFEVKKEGGDQATIIVTSKNVVKEPFLNFLVEADWSKGRVLREFTVLLDPPFFDDSQSSDRVIAAIIEDEVEPIETPSAVNATEDSTSESIEALVTDNEISIVNAASVNVAKGTTLWSIASQFKDSEHSMAQVMLAMQRTNIDAFLDNNINSLKIGAIFRAPTDEELNQLNKQEAYAQVIEQHGRWDKTAGKVIEPSVSIVSSDVGSDGVEVKQNATVDFSLLTPVNSDPESAGQGEVGDENNALKNQLALAEEQLDAFQIEKQEMQSRIADLEARLSKFDELQKMLEIEDDSLAQLQADQTIDSLEADPPQNISTPISEVVVDAPALEEGAKDKDLSLLDRILPPGIIKLIPSLSWFYNNPTVFWGGGGLVLLLLGLFLYRRSKSNEDDGMTLSNVDLDESPSSLNDGTMPVGLAQRSADANDDPLSANAMSQVDQTEPTDETTYRTVPTEQDDLLNEVDVYLAYGLYDNAEELLAQSLNANPDRIDYRAKLLDTYFATKNIDGFSKEAALLKSSGLSVDQYWDKVQVMGYELAPDNPLFLAGKDSNIHAADLEVVKPEMTDFEVGASEDYTDDLSNSDFNLEDDINDVQPLQADEDTLSTPDSPDLGGVPQLEDNFPDALESLEFTLDAETEDNDLDDVSDTNLNTPLQATEALESDGLEDLSLNFDLDEVEELSSESESDLHVAEDSLEPTDDIEGSIDKKINLAQSDDNFNADADADDISLITAQDSEEHIQFDPDEPDKAYDSDSLDLDGANNLDEIILSSEVDINDIGDLMLPDDVDEVATKLDLARAFIDMGDAEGARDSLEEVLTEGTGEQKAEAAELLENM
jgi:pilus assembly protein FimV